jgi:predicted DNA-binding protein (MmcQ/YjbR family)
MTADEFNACCAALPATTHVVQWEGADVWKVGGKMFAIGAFTWGGQAGITFKVTPLAFEALSDAPGLRPAPYLASRGLKWIQHYGKPGLDDAALADHLRISHLLVVRGLSRRLRKELGLEALAAG